MRPRCYLCFQSIFMMSYRLSFHQTPCSLQASHVTPGTKIEYRHGIPTPVVRTNPLIWMVTCSTLRCLPMAGNWLPYHDLVSSYGISKTRNVLPSCNFKMRIRMEIQNTQGTLSWI